MNYFKLVWYLFCFGWGLWLGGVVKEAAFVLAIIVSSVALVLSVRDFIADRGSQL